MTGVRRTSLWRLRGPPLELVATGLSPTHWGHWCVSLQACVCACDDIVTHFEPERVLTTVHFLVNPSESLSLTKFNDAVLDPCAHFKALSEEPQTAQGEGRKAPCVVAPTRVQPSEAPDQHLLSYALLCIFLTTLVLLYLFPPPDD